MKAPAYNSVNLYTGEHRPNPIFKALDKIDHDNALAEVDRQIAARTIERLRAELDAVKKQRDQLLIELGYVKLAEQGQAADEVAFTAARRARRDRNRGNR